MNSRIAALALSLPACCGVAHSADTGRLACGTTAECNQQAAKVGATVEALNSNDNTTSKTDKTEKGPTKQDRHSRQSMTLEHRYCGISGVVRIDCADSHFHGVGARGAAHPKHYRWSQDRIGGASYGARCTQCSIVQQHPRA